MNALQPLYDVAVRLLSLQSALDNGPGPTDPVVDIGETWDQLDAAVTEARELIALPSRRDVVSPTYETLRTLGYRPTDPDTVAEWQRRAADHLVTALRRRAREEWESTLEHPSGPDHQRARDLAGRLLTAHYDSEQLPDLPGPTAHHNGAKAQLWAVARETAEALGLMSMFDVARVINASKFEVGTRPLPPEPSDSWLEAATAHVATELARLPRHTGAGLWPSTPSGGLARLLDEHDLVADIDSGATLTLRPGEPDRQHTLRATWWTGETWLLEHIDDSGRLVASINAVASDTAAAYLNAWWLTVRDNAMRTAG